MNRLGLLALLVAAPPLVQEPASAAEPPLPPVLRLADQRGNGDGVIQRDELSARLRRFFDSSDTDGDGVLTAEEIERSRAEAFTRIEKVVDVLGPLDAETLSLLGGREHEVGWAEGTLIDASRDREIGYLVRYPLDVEGLIPVVLLSNGGFGSPFGQHAYGEFASAYARLGFLAVSIGHRPSANEVRHRYDRPLDVSFLVDALVRVRAGSLRIPGGGSDDALPLPEEFGGVPDVERIGHTGHSFGGFTSHAVAGARWSPTMGIRDFRDPRIDAIVPMSPQGEHRFGGYDEGPDNNSWSDIRVPAYLICGAFENPDWRRQPFDRYPLEGDKYLTVAAGLGHNLVNGGPDAQRLIALNTALFFHVYLRGGEGRDRIGTLAWIDGWTLETKRLDASGSEAAARAAD